MRKSIRFTGQAALVAALGVLIGAGCRRAPERPELTLHFKATTLEGEPLPGVSVEALGETRGTTDTKGELTFSFTADIGDEFTTSAKLEREGLRFEPWQQAVVVRKWDPDRPESREYHLEAKLEPIALAAQIEVDAGGESVAGAEVRLDGQPAKPDADGRISVDLGTRLTRPAKVTVKLKGFQPFAEETTLAAGETFVARLAKIGIQYGRVQVAYQTMGKVLPVVGANVALGGRALGKTDKSGRVRYQAPARQTTVEVHADGYLPSPGTATVPARRPAQVSVTLVPREPPTYSLALPMPENASTGDADVDGVLAEIEDKLGDQLFSQGCFTRAASEKRADAVVSVAASRGDRGLLLSVRVTDAKGKPIGGFAEQGRFGRVRSLTEAVAEKVVDVFPFEGHVLAFEEDRPITSLGSGGGRRVRKGDGIALYRWDGKMPPKLAPLGRAVVRKVDREFSRVELQKGAQRPAVGDTVVLLPRALEASFDSAVTLTVKAGRPGDERTFADVNVYRDGMWVGTTSRTGKIRVPVSSDKKHAFLFVKGGIKPYGEEIVAAETGGQKTIILPNVFSRVKLESQPSGARVRIDGRDVGQTPLETDVVMGFHRVIIDAGGDWRAYDEVMEFATTEVSYTGSRRIVLRKDVLKRSQALLDRGDVDGAIKVLSGVQPRHPDYSAAHHRLAGLYLDEKKDASRAISEYQKVLERPENRELVNKRFAVTFLNLGRAYYLLGTPDGYRKAIENLVIARDNKRFFPKDQHDRATHDTHYFLALATHKLYHLEGGERLLQETSRYWNDYFDYFPKSLQGSQDVQQSRASAEQYYEEIKLKLEGAE